MATLPSEESRPGSIFWPTFITFYMAVFAIVFVAVLWLQTCTAQNYQKLVAQGKGFDGNPAWDWLQNLTIPLPKYTYNSTAVEKIDEALYQRWVFAEYVQSWLDFFEDYDLAQLNWSDPSTFVCSTSDYVWDTNYTDPNRNSCSDGSFVSTPWFVVDDLTYVPPYELCNFDSDPYCDVYRNATLQAINSTGDFLGELKKQKEEATKNNTRSQYLRIGNILGVGYNVTQECRDNINAALRDADEFTSAGTQAATTIAALIPALLTVGNLFVPRSSEVFATSFLVGIMTAMFSLGLPVSSISAIKDSQRFDVSSWVFKARRSVTKFGEIKNRATDGTKNQPKNPCSLQELQRWSKELPDGQEILTEEQTGTDLTFSDIKKGVQKWKHRTHLGGLPALFISCSQFFLFLLTVGPLYFSQGTPWLLFDCRGYWTSTWMFVAAGVSAIFRVFMWERGSHERVKLYSMSDTTLERFRWFTGQNVATSQKAPTAFVEESMPPLYPPLIAKIESIMWKVVFAIVPFFHPEKPQHRRHSAAQPSIHTQEKNSASRRWKIFLNDVRNPKQFIKHAFARSEPPAAARRWRPLYLLLHLSTAGRNPIWTLLTGFIQGFILIVLTVFFAAQWGKFTTRSVPFLMISLMFLRR